MGRIQRRHTAAGTQPHSELPPGTRRDGWPRPPPPRAAAAAAAPARPRPRRRPPRPPRPRRSCTPARRTRTRETTCQQTPVRHATE